MERIWKTMKYEGTIYRPPVEAYTFLLQVATGCTHNGCTFCNMFEDKKIRLIDEKTIRYNLNEAKVQYQKANMPMERIFLVDGDAFALSANKLEEIIDIIHEYFPECSTISMYSSVTNVKNKTDEELIKLKNLGVNDLYIGHESGVEDIIESINKGHTVQDSYEEMERLNKVGIRHNALLMLGLGGKGRGVESGIETAKLLNAIKPSMILFTTLGVFEGTKLYEDEQAGKFTQAGELEILLEQKTLIENLNLPKTYLWSKHPLNSTRIEGMLGEDKEKMIEEIKYNMEHIDEEEFEKNFKRDRL